MRPSLSVVRRRDKRSRSRMRTKNRGARERSLEITKIYVKKITRPAESVVNCHRFEYGYVGGMHSKREEASKGVRYVCERER